MLRTASSETAIRCSPRCTHETDGAPKYVANRRTAAALTTQTVEHYELFRVFVRFQGRNRKFTLCIIIEAMYMGSIAAL